ncbi:gustatory receptor 23a isoform X1 [Drosophila ficusphila]|uniref:gustatory receptor 23a isoform X1 n=1 Tax=Drosophila ficusphila TaxID=30025 RepID=UPI0007E68F0D|nr:gustatory receptor 23a isoform X1 [Drosophila ficusphila]
MFPPTRIQGLSRVVLKLFHLILVGFSLRSSRLSRLILWLRFLFWLSWFIAIWTQSLIFAQQIECHLDCILRHTLTFFQTVSHAFIVVDTFLRGFKVEGNQMEEVVVCQAADPWMASTVLAMLLPILGVEYLVCSNAPEYEYRVRIYHLKTLPSFLALQMQIISFILEVMELNIRVRQAKQQLVILARELSCRWPQSKQRSDHLDKQIYRIQALKLRYNELHQLFDKLNSGFGGSLLTIIMVFFALFVCNSYWLFVDVRTSPLRVYAILLNLGFIFNVALQMSAVCWHCQQSHNLGRQIGCLISKLVKPQGSKRYNDLVSEFSLQTLHQRFEVTAKDFFSLNLHLLSSMFAAVVTYLVILIQFMFAERNSRHDSG